MFDVFQVDDRTDVLFPAFMQAMNPRHPWYWVLERDAVVLQSRVCFVSSDCVAAIYIERVSAFVRPPWPSKYCADAAPHAGNSSRLHVLLLRQWDLSAATATASSIRVLLWHVTAAFQGPREQHALTPAAPSHCRSLDVLAWLLEFSASIQEP